MNKAPPGMAARVGAAALLAALLAAPGCAQAQYPAKAVRVIVPFTPGSATDILGRVVGDQLTKSLGQPFVVDNKPGAGGIIGTQAAKNEAPDGYTQVIAVSGPFRMNPARPGPLPHHPPRALTPSRPLPATPH